MKAQKVRDFDENELKNQLKEMDEQMFRLHFQMSMGQMDGLKKVRQMRKDRARVYTILRERELAGEKKVTWPETQQPLDNAKKALKNEKVGEVVSTKMQKTIVVEVSRRVPHPLYKRIIGKRKKFYAHDEEGRANLGDVVRIIECRPLSKRRSGGSWRTSCGGRPRWRHSLKRLWT